MGLIMRRKDDTPQLDPCKLLNFAYTIFLSFMAYLFCVTFVPIPESGQDNAKYIVGFMVGSGLTAIIVFYFSRKGATIDNRMSEPIKNDDEKEEVK